ncbi:hypothetical protein [Saccharopolyspora phatthalungensis]|uniref:Uncharacterized protein n=1 Tax=Saccharopolyspora phatthalungensis TaxID=664693 RepID=A0A840Q7J1_9PSEU|nr:hypothetical protein [Saccharopolyspora phatthalungensis]MBB5155907.1 hypothetical protein [Saccharopolyspora phatthalungensis]
MPRSNGGILIESAEATPSGGLAAFTGIWNPKLSPGSTREGALVLQLLPPLHCPDAHDRVDVRLWYARHRQWQLLRYWPRCGTDWPYHIAPWIRAALPDLSVEP